MKLISMGKVLLLLCTVLMVATSATTGNDGEFLGGHRIRLPNGNNQPKPKNRQTNESCNFEIETKESGSFPLKSKKATKKQVEGLAERYYAATIDYAYTAGIYP